MSSTESVPSAEAVPVTSMPPELIFSTAVATTKIYTMVQTTTSQKNTEAEYVKHFFFI
jgi:hypothetical protein